MKNKKIIEDHSNGTLEYYLNKGQRHLLFKSYYANPFLYKCQYNQLWNYGYYDNGVMIGVWKRYYYNQNIELIETKSSHVFSNRIRNANGIKIVFK